MVGSERPAPLITIVDPGHAGAPSEPPRARLPAGPRTPLPAAVRVLVLAAFAVLGAGVLVALDVQDRAPPARVPIAAAAGYAGVTAEVEVVSEQGPTAVLELVLTLAPGDTGRADSAAAVQPAPQLKLVEVTGRGVAVRLVRRAPPLLLGYLGRLASGTERVLRLPLEVAVADCSVEVGVQPGIMLGLRSGHGPVGRVRVQADPLVDQVLRDMVRRTCRRPHG